MYCIELPNLSRISPCSTVLIMNDTKVAVILNFITGKFGNHSLLLWWKAGQGLNSLVKEMVVQFSNKMLWNLNSSNQKKVVVVIQARRLTMKMCFKIFFALLLLMKSCEGSVLTEMEKPGKLLFHLFHSKISLVLVLKGC